MWPLLLPTAAAHLPHDEVVAVAPDPAGRVVVAMRASGSAPGAPWLLLESTGGPWEVVSRPATSGSVVGLTWAGERLALLDSAGMVWWGPTEWEAQAGPTGLPLALAGDSDGRAIVATTAGLWRIGDAGWEELASGTFTKLRAQDGHVAAVAGSGALWRDGAWLPALDGAVDLSADGTWAATADSVYHLDGDWVACGALPVGDPAVDEEARVVHLAAEGEELLIGTGQWVYRSTDGCASFTEERPFPDRADYGDDPGDVEDAGDACTGVWLGNGMSVVTGYRGVAIERGAGWSSGRLVDGAFARGIAHADGRWLSSSYGGGPIRAEEGLATLTHLDASLAPVERYGRQIVGFGDEAFLYCGDLDCWRSDDGGSTYTELELPFAEVGGLGRGEAALFAFAEAGGEPTIARSFDGVAWEERPVGEGATRGLRLAVLDGEPVLLARTMNPDAIYSSRDDGDTWAPLVDDGGPVNALLPWPEGDGSRLIRAGVAIQVSDDGGATWEEAAAGPTGATWLVSVGDVVVAADVAGTAWSSTDGGSTWSTGGWIGAVTDLAPVVDGGVIVAPTFRGLRWSADAGATWHDAPAWDALPAPNADLLCQPATVGSCGRTSTLSVLPGDVIALTTRGSTFVHAGTGPLTVTVDGVELGVVAADEEVALPGSGWRVVTAVVSEAMEVDAVYARIDGEVLPGDTQPPAWRISAVSVGAAQDACGCRAGVGGQGTGPILAGLVLLLRRRRPRWPRSRPSRPPRAAPRPGPASSPGSGGP